MKKLCLCNGELSVAPVFRTPDSTTSALSLEFSALESARFLYGAHDVDIGFMGVSVGGLV